MPNAKVIPFPDPRTRRLSRWARAEVVQDSLRLLLDDGGPEIEIWLSPAQARFWAETLRQLAETAEGEAASTCSPLVQWLRRFDWEHVPTATLRQIVGFVKRAAEDG